MAATTYTLIDLGASDGKPGYPTNLTRTLGADGSYDYYREVEENDSKSVLWRAKAALNIIDVFGKEGADLAKNGPYILRELPEHYKLFDHIRGSAQPGGSVKERRDTYLYGHPSGKRYRSPKEFFPHVNYLAQFSRRNGPDGSKICHCDFCPGKKAKGTPSRANRSASSQREAASMKEETEKDIIVRARQAVATRERLSDTDSAGWIMRKGEVVWVWLATNPESAGKDRKSIFAGAWVAGIVIGRPNFTVPLPRKSGASLEGGSVPGFVADDRPMPWELLESDTKNYTVQLCSGTRRAGVILNDLPQRFLKPWLSRPQAATNPSPNLAEHPSIPAARGVAVNFSLFDAIPDKTVVSEDGKKTTTDYHGIFIGSEKVWVNDPIRLKTLDPKLPAYAEDVMVPERIYTLSTPSPTSPGKVATKVIFRGRVYTAYPSHDTFPITPARFATMHPRMRRQNGSDYIIQWHTRAKLRLEVNITSVLGRWYEPVALQEWTKSPGTIYGSDNPPTISKVSLKKWANNRAEALGCDSLNGVDMIDRATSRIRPAVLVSKSADAMDLDETEDEEPPANLNAATTVTEDENMSGGGSEQLAGDMMETAEAEEAKDDDDDDDDGGVVPFKGKYRY